MKTASLAHAPCAKQTRSGFWHGVNTGKKLGWIRSTGITVGLILLALLTACAPQPEKPTEQAKPEVKGPELLMGRSAFQKVFVAARGWNQDARPYRIESVATSDGNGRDGKSAVWRSGFASAAQRVARTYTWSGSTAEGAPSRGVSFGIEDSYSPTNASMQTWDTQFLKIDSDQALATAQKHGGDKVLEKSPDLPVTYVCDWNRNSNQLIWHVIFGPNRENSKLAVSVDASTGAFIRVEK